MMLPYKYFVCTSDKQKDWEDALLQYRTNPIDSDSPVDIFKKTASELNLEEQFKLISTLPNYHKWQWNRNEIVNLHIRRSFPVLQDVILDLQETESSRHVVFEIILTILFTIVYSILLLLLTRARYQRKYKINSRGNLKGKRRSLEKLMADMEKVLLLLSFVDIATVM